MALFAEPTKKYWQPPHRTTRLSNADRMEKTDEEEHALTPREIEREMIALRATTVLERTWKGAFHLEQPTLVSDRGRNDVLRCRVTVRERCRRE